MKSKFKGLFTSLMLIIMLVLNTTFVDAATLTSKLNVYFLNVGQADCELIENNGHFALIDAGSNANETTVLNFLKSKGVKKLDLIIASNPNEDHIGSMDAVVKNYNFDTIIMPKVTTTKTSYKNLAAALNSKNKRVTAPTASKKYKIGNAELTILAPNASKYDAINDYSVVARVTYGSNSFLFMGDSETISENQILTKKLTVKSDVIKVGNHGSSSSTSNAFLNAVNPKYAVIEVGANNSYGNPSSTTFDKLNAKSIKTYRTDLNGTVTATSNGTQIVFNVVKVQSFDIIKLLDNGDDYNKLVFVIMGDGYTSKELTKFKVDSQKLIDGILNEEPYKKYKKNINFYIVNVASNVSGASVDRNNIIDTYFGSSYNYAYNIQRLLAPTKLDKVYNILDNSKIDYDQGIVLVNSDIYGGSGGSIATTSTNEYSTEILLHELGHSFGHLGDEYFAGDQYTRETVNVTRESNPKLVKWKSFIGKSNIGVYPMEGTSGWYIPSENCKMKALNNHFCAVCENTLEKNIIAETVKKPNF